MKKILAIAIVAIMTVALCVSAAANLNIDRIFVNANVMAEGTDVKENDPIEANVGDKLYILGWAYGEASNLKEIVYSLDEGEDVACPDNYRDRADVAATFQIDESFGVHAGFGHDTAEEGGLLELPGATAKAGEFVLHIKAVYNDGTDEVKDFNLKVSGEAKAEDPKGDETKGEDKPADNPKTADASVIAIAAVACVALAGVVVAKKVK